MGNKTILLVEDQVVTAMSESQIISNIGYTVLIAKNGLEAIKKIKDNSEISLVLMDINLGKGMDGTEAALEILKIRELPIIFLTSHSEKEMVEKVKGITRYGYVLKNSGEFVLLESINMANELFDANQKLKKSEQKFRRIFEEGQFGITIADKNYNFIDANPAFCTMIGYDIKEIKKKTFIDITTEDRVKTDIQNVNSIALGEKYIYKTEKPYKKKNGDIFWGSLITTAVRDENNNIEYYLAMVLDVTEHKKNEKELQKKQEFIEKLIESMNDGISVIQPDGVRIMVNRSLCDMTGYSNEELIGTHPPSPIWPPEHLETIKHAFEKMKSGQLKEAELIFKRKNGERFPVLLSPSVMKDESGKVICYITSIKDISEWKQTEQHLQLLKFSIETSLDGVYWMDMKGKFIYVNDAACKALGYTRDELLNMSIFDINPSTSKDSWNEFWEYLREKKVISGESIHKRKDGTLFPVEISSTYIKLKNEEYCNGFAHDITSRNQIYEALKESEERYRMITEMATDYFVKLKIIEKGDFVLEYTSENFNKITGRIMDETKHLSSWENIFHPEDFPAVKVFIERLIFTGETDSIECRTKIQDRSRWIDIIANPQKDAAGNVASIIAAIKDISARKQAEESFKQSEEKYRKLVENLNDVIFILDAQGKITYASPRTEPVTGYTSDEITDRSFREIVDPSDLPDVEKSFNKVLNGKFGSSEFRYITKNKTINWARTSSRPIMENNQVTGVYGIFSDVTERKLSDQALRNSEAQLSNALKIAHLGPWEYDVLKDIFTFNDAFYAIFRTTADEVGGYTMSSGEYSKRFIHPDDIDVVGIETHKALETGDPYFSRQFEHKFIYSNGEIGYLNVRFFIIKDDHGKTIRTYGVNQDITEQKKVVNEIKKLLDERNLLLTEVHHRIKNDMNIISSMLMIQIDSCEDQIIKNVLMETEVRINVMFNIYNELYMGRDFDYISLRTYITNLISNIKYIYNERCNTRINMNIEDIPIDRKISFPVGMIINELITNSYKYAFFEKKSYNNIIDVTIEKKKNGDFFIKVNDNGKGFPERILRNELPGFGLKLINMLSRQINGITKLYNDNGAVFEMLVKKDVTRNSQ